MLKEHIMCNQDKNNEIIKILGKRLAKHPILQEEIKKDIIELAMVECPDSKLTLSDMHRCDLEEAWTNLMLISQDEID